MRLGPSTGIRCQLDRLYNRGILVLGLVDPCRDRPHPHQPRGEWAHEVARVEPAGIITPRQPNRHAVVDGRYHLVGIRGDDPQRSHTRALAKGAAVSTKRCLSTHLPGVGAGESRRTGGAVPRTGGEGEEVMHMPSVHTSPVRHGIRHPPQLAWSLEVSTHFPKQNICPPGHCRPCAFTAN